MQGNAMQQEFVLSESFKALLEGIFSNPNQSKKLMYAFEEVVNDRATTQRLNLESIKQKAVNEIKQEIVTKDFVEAKILETKLELKQDIAEIKTELSRTRVEIKYAVFAVATLMLILQPTIFEWIKSILGFTK